jgi:hypothetical protein
VNESSLDGLAFSLKAVYHLCLHAVPLCLPVVPLCLPAVPPMSTCSPRVITCNPPMSTCSPLSLFQKGDLLLKVNESSLDGLALSLKAVYHLCLHAVPLCLPVVPLCLPAVPPMTPCSLLSLFQKGDLLLKVNESSLDGLTHSQAVATLKATINLSSVVLVALEVTVVNTFADQKYHYC